MEEHITMAGQGGTCMEVETLQAAISLWGVLTNNDTLYRPSYKPDPRSTNPGWTLISSPLQNAYEALLVTSACPGFG